MRARFFAAHGWLVVRGAVDAARVRALEQALDAVLPPSSWAAWGGRVVEAAGVSHAAPLLAEQARDASIGALAAELLGAASVQLLQDTALVKPPRHAGDVAWHRDWGFLSFLGAPRVLTVRLALTPCTAASGCMHVYDGSHRWDVAAEDLALRHGAIDDQRAALPPALRERAAASEVALELEPGDISIHHALTFHGSAANGSAWPRKTFAVRLFDGDCRLDATRLPSPEALQHFPTEPDGRFAEAAFARVWPVR